MSNTQDATPSPAPATSSIPATSPTPAPAATPAAPSTAPAAAPAATAAATVKTEAVALRRLLVSRLLGVVAHHAHTIILVIAGLLFLVAILLATH